MKKNSNFYPYYSLGNLGDVAKAGGIHLYLKELHEKHGPVVAFWWGEQRVVSVASPDLWKDIQGLFDRPRELLVSYRGSLTGHVSC